MEEGRQIILEGVTLSKSFVSRSLFRKSNSVVAVDNVSIKIFKGETFAIVGESGCGKSTLARLLLNLIEPTKGDVIFEGRNLGALRGQKSRTVRRDLQMIFQDPFASLNPAMTAG